MQIVAEQQTVPLERFRRNGVPRLDGGVKAATRRWYSSHSAIPDNDRSLNQSRAIVDQSWADLRLFPSSFSASVGGST